MDLNHLNTTVAEVQGSTGLIRQTLDNKCPKGLGEIWTRDQDGQGPRYIDMIHEKILDLSHLLYQMGRSVSEKTDLSDYARRMIRNAQDPNSETKSPFLNLLKVLEHLHRIINFDPSKHISEKLQDIGKVFPATYKFSGDLNLKIADMAIAKVFGEDSQESRSIREKLVKGYNPEILQEAQAWAQGTLEALLSNLQPIMRLRNVPKFFAALIDKARIHHGKGDTPQYLFPEGFRASIKAQLGLSS